MDAGVVQRQRRRTQNAYSAGSNPAPGTRVDPVTGLSRRTLLALGLIVVLGIAASTVATMIDVRGEPGCADERYGCARFEPGEPVQIGSLFPDDLSGDRGVQAALSLSGEVRGRSLKVLSFDGRCSAEAATEAAREFASDPPGEPPVVAVLGETCAAAEIPVAQILSDSGITFISVLEAADPPGPVSYYLAGSPGTSVEEAAFTAAEAVVRSAERVAVEHNGDLLIPRTQLRDALVAAGLSPA
jgi:hypothetical protein